MDKELDKKGTHKFLEELKKVFYFLCQKKLSYIVH